MPPKSDPRRLPRRNHHQQGPGFLFVAAQGGRPAAPHTGPTTAGPTTPSGPPGIIEDLDEGRDFRA